MTVVRPLVTDYLPFFRWQSGLYWELSFGYYFNLGEWWRKTPFSFFKKLWNSFKVVFFILKLKRKTSLFSLMEEGISLSKEYCLQ